MDEELKNKSLSDIRVIAQAYGIPDIFEKDQIHLIQEIELKQANTYTPKTDLPLRPEYDARLMTANPSELGDMDDIIELLEQHIKLGLKLTFDHESWFMTWGKKSDTGSLRMPLRHILDCAEKVLM